MGRRRARDLLMLIDHVEADRQKPSEDVHVDVLSLVTLLQHV